MAQNYPLSRYKHCQVVFWGEKKSRLMKRVNQLKLVPLISDTIGDKETIMQLYEVAKHFIQSTMTMRILINFLVTLNSII